MTVEIPLTPTEITALEALAAAVPSTVSDYLALLVREALETESPLVPNLG